jgi:hypothetical protein
MDEQKTSRYAKFKGALIKYSIGNRAKHLGIAAICGGLSFGAGYIFNDSIECQQRINTGFRSLRETGEYIEKVVVSDNVGTQELSNIVKMIAESNVRTAYPIANQLDFIQQIYTAEKKEEQRAVKSKLLKMKSSLENVDTNSEAVAFFGVMGFVAAIGFGAASLRKLYRSAFKPN